MFVEATARYHGIVAGDTAAPRGPLAVHTNSRSFQRTGNRQTRPDVAPLLL